jgi:hypothetical protein
MEANKFFASVYSDFSGYNVAVFEVDKTHENPVLLLHKSESSDMLAIEPIAGIIRPFATSGFMGCYFDKVENDTVKLVPNGVIELLGCTRFLLTVNANPRVSLTNLALKINGGSMRVKGQLAGSIQADLKRATVDEMSHQISNLIQIADNWDTCIGKSCIEFQTSGSSRTSVSDEYRISLDRFG